MNFNKELEQLQAIQLSRGNPGALRAAMELLVVDSGVVLCLLSIARIGGRRLYIWWNDIFDRDTEAFAEAVKGLSYYKLTSLSCHLERGSDIDFVRSELGRSKSVEAK